MSPCKLERFRPKGAVCVFTLFVLACFSGLPGRGADAPPASSPIQGDETIRLDSFSVGALPIMSFGFSVQIIKNSATKMVESMMVSGVGRGSQAERAGLSYYTQILSIDGTPVENFAASFAHGSELNKKLMNRKKGDHVTLEILPPDSQSPQFVTIYITRDPDGSNDQWGLPVRATRGY